MSCSTNPESDSIYDIQSTVLAEIKKPDSYYLKECKTPPIATSDELEYILKYIDNLMTDYADCSNRFKLLVEQISK